MEIWSNLSEFSQGGEAGETAVCSLAGAMGWGTLWKQAKLFVTKPEKEFNKVYLEDSMLY